MLITSPSHSHQGLFLRWQTLVPHSGWHLHMQPSWHGHTQYVLASRWRSHHISPKPITYNCFTNTMLSTLAVPIMTWPGPLSVRCSIHPIFHLLPAAMTLAPHQISVHSQTWQCHHNHTHLWHKASESLAMTICSIRMPVLKQHLSLYSKQDTFFQATSSLCMKYTHYSCTYSVHAYTCKTMTSYGWPHTTKTGHARTNYLQRKHMPS